MSATFNSIVESILDTLRNPSVTNQPPSADEQRRNDLYTIALIVVALLLGSLVGNAALNAVNEYRFEDGLPSLVVPAGWITQTEENGDLRFSAVDPASVSMFDSRIELFARARNEGEDLSMLNVSWPLQRSRQLERFRTLSSSVVSGPDGQDALLLSYAYLADPTRDSGTLGLPVVVRGADLIFLAGEETASQVVVISTSADAADWESAAEAFQALYDHLGVREP